MVSAATAQNRSALNWQAAARQSRAGKRTVQLSDGMVKRCEAMATLRNAAQWQSQAGQCGATAKHGKPKRGDGIAQTCTAEALRR